MKTQKGMETWCRGQHWRQILTLSFEKQFIPSNSASQRPPGNNILDMVQFVEWLNPLETHTQEKLIKIISTELKNNLNLIEFINNLKLV